MSMRFVLSNNCNFSKNVMICSVIGDSKKESGKGMLCWNRKWKLIILPEIETRILRCKLCYNFIGNVVWQGAGLWHNIGILAKTSRQKWRIWNLWGQAAGREVWIHRGVGLCTSSVRCGSRWCAGQISRSGCVFDFTVCLCHCFFPITRVKKVFWL